MNTLFIVIGFIGGLLVATSIAGYRYYSGLEIKSQFDTAVDERKKISTKMDSLNKASIKEINKKKDSILLDLDNSFESLNTQIDTKTKLLKKQNDKLISANKEIDNNLKSIKKINSLSYKYLEKIESSILKELEEKNVVDHQSFKNLELRFFNTLILFISKERFLKSSKEEKIETFTTMHEIADELSKHPYALTDNELYRKLSALKEHIISPYLLYLKSKEYDGKVDDIKSNTKHDEQFFDEYQKLDIFRSIQTLPIRRFIIKNDEK